MKKTLFTLALLASIALSACNFNRSTDNISLSTEDSQNKLSFTANYPEDKTGAIQGYIESYFKEDRIFKSVADAKKVDIKLQDGTQFYLNYEPGFISISFNRNKNSFSSYQRMKKMVAGFGKVLKD